MGKHVLFYNYTVNTVGRNAGGWNTGSELIRIKESYPRSSSFLRAQRDIHFGLEWEDNSNYNVYVVSAQLLRLPAYAASLSG